MLSLFTKCPAIRIKKNLLVTAKTLVDFMSSFQDSDIEQKKCRVFRCRRISFIIIIIEHFGEMVKMLDSNDCSIVEDINSNGDDKTVDKEDVSEEIADIDKIMVISM